MKNPSGGNIGFYCHESSRGEMRKIPLGGYLFRFPREEEKTRTRTVGFLKSPEIPLEGLIKIPLERYIKIPLEGNFSDSFGSQKKLGPELWDF